MNDFMNIKIRREDAIGLLLDRVDYNNIDDEDRILYEKMYENYVYGGCFDGAEFDPSYIVDNDVCNCTIIESTETEFDDLLKAFKEESSTPGDISTHNTNYNYIEATDNNDNPTKFLVRN